MNWLWVGIGTLLLAVVLEWFRRGKNRYGMFVNERLKTFSARLTVAFLFVFALFLPFISIGVGFGRRLILVAMVVGVIIANFIHLEGREARD